MHNDPTRTTPIGLIRYAHDFFDSARAVEDQLGKGEPYDLVSAVPSLYLIGRSIELGLKSYLLSENITLRELSSRKYGHDLHACHRKAKELGLLSLSQFRPEEEAALELLNELYSTKQLEYIVTGAKIFPPFNLVESFTRKLIRGVSGHVGYKTFNR